MLFPFPDRCRLWHVNEAMSTALKNLGSLTKEEVRNVCAWDKCLFYVAAEAANCWPLASYFAEETSEFFQIYTMDLANMRKHKQS